MTSTSFDGLVAEVAGLAYPSLHLREAKKKVRDRTDYAREQGHITVTGNINVGLRANRIDILRWAQEVWPEIKSILKLPNQGTLAGRLPSLTAQFHAVLPPTDKKELQQAFAAQSALLHRTTKELADCRAQNTALENELAALKRRKESIRKKRSAAGKKGGRGHTRW